MVTLGFFVILPLVWQLPICFVTAELTTTFQVRNCASPGVVGSRYCCRRSANPSLRAMEKSVDVPGREHVGCLRTGARWESSTSFEPIVRRVSSVGYHQRILGAEV